MKQYPYIGIWKDPEFGNLKIKFTSPGSGLVLTSSGRCPYRPGSTHTNFDEKAFTRAVTSNSRTPTPHDLEIQANKADKLQLFYATKGRDLRKRASKLRSATIKFSEKQFDTLNALSNTVDTIEATRNKIQQQADDMYHQENLARKRYIAAAQKMSKQIGSNYVDIIQRIELLRKKRKRS